MGRSVPTYRMTLEGILASLNDFRRALRDDDKVVFDELMKKARAHAAAGSYQASLDPTDTMFISILIEMVKDNLRLREEIEKGKTRMRDVQGGSKT
ncbi:MAG: hypothetical protein KAI64_00915 [Thermoplasmata archaeon]|nr:hypothetical protein [Thermoplasmata archaeon]